MFVLNVCVMTHLHQFGVMSSVDYNTHNPLGVSELGSTQQHLVWSKRSWTKMEKK